MLGFRGFLEEVVPNILPFLVDVSVALTEVVVQETVNHLPYRLRWAPHNLLAHPTMELIYVTTGNLSLGDWIHRMTVPLGQTNRRGEEEGDL